MATSHLKYIQRRNQGIQGVLGKCIQRSISEMYPTGISSYLASISEMYLMRISKVQQRFSRDPISSSIEHFKNFFNEYINGNQ